MAQDTSLRGAKVAQGGQNISREVAAPPTFRTYDVVYGQPLKLNS